MATHFIDPVKTKPERDGPMMCADGGFLCAKCVKANAALIDAAADDLCGGDSWACVGYCGDRIYSRARMVLRKATGGTRRERLKVNKPDPKKDACAHCGAPFGPKTRGVK